MEGNQIIHLIFTGMKTALLLLLLFLVNSGSAETFVPYTPDSLKKGDWVEIESVHYYPYIAPGIEEKVPWRAENIRRVIFKATVTDLNEHTLTLDYTLKNLYDCRNEAGKPGFYYFDSRYRQDFTFDHEKVGQRLLRVIYDRDSQEVQTLDKQETIFSYSKNYVPFGVRQAGLSTYPETTLRDSLLLDKLLIPAAQTLLTSWQEEGMPRLAQNTRIIDASFSLPPNTEFTCSHVNFDLSDDSTIHKKIFIAYPTEYKVGERVTLLLTPGDSITQDKERFATTHKRHYQGRGSEQNNIQYSFRRFADIYDPDMRSLNPITPDQVKKAFQTRDSLFQIALEKDFKHLDPYWRKVFERSEQYFEGMFVLEFYMRATDKQAWQESGLLDWQAPYFASVNPLIDFAYSLQKTDAATYYYFLYTYSNYKKQEFKSDNLCLNKQGKLSPQEEYIINKQLFSGFPKYMATGSTLQQLMHTNTLSEIEGDYNDFIRSCPDTSLTNLLKRTYDKLLPFETGKNIRESGLMIADSLHLVKGSDRKYILLFLSREQGLPAPNLQNALDFKKCLESEGLVSIVQLELYSKFQSNNTERVKPFKAISDLQIEELRRKGLGAVTILMREDGTILYRQFTGWRFDPKPALAIIQNDLNREDESFNDFLKGFKEGVLGTLLIAAIICIAYYFRTKEKQKKERNRRRIRELELRAIRSQMNPHFIFNALSSIQNLINRSASQEANEYLIDFSRLLRKVLATSEKKLVPLSDEIEQLQLYLKLEQLRFPFSYSLTVDKNIEPDAIEIPGMLIQPFVENAVKHGIAPRGTGEIIIRLSLQDQLLTIDIIDDGPGIETEAEGGFGIRAISNEFEILKDLYNTEIGITIENRQKKESVSGCHVRLSIPL
ncbi:ATPase/histidine kinase/DNA gyrase B/HSP90 domain protein [Parabacteroides johnsonii DSM 18315]|uniref:ATPase/histidine kinase/DNA gyrase B/HSP90 domain protein n=2 Tax=Parabacteroides johnsonii TaxID=387661 RepID=B7B6D0_9BACT|nr:ATPase/histidine kinase/DNA gyrase B/HSP90 domain protein [Parabacteroides johnsonii DSM 18315]